MRPEVVLLLGASFWGLGWMPLEHLARQGLLGMPVVVYSYSLLCLLAVPVLLAQQRAWWPQRRALAVVCLCGGWATAGLVGALSEGDVVRAMLLFYLAPVWSLLGSRLLLGERLNASRIGAVVLAMIGIALTLGIDADTFRPLQGSDWLALSAGIAFAANNLATRAAGQIPLASKTLAAFVGAALTGGLFCLLQEIALPAVAPMQWLQLGLFGVFWLTAMCAAQYGFSHVETSRAAVLVLVELVVAVLTAAAFGERQLGPGEWFGGALVLIAALLAERPTRPAAAVGCEAKP
ncbi:DMT family transporter [Pseudomonas sp. NCHU5208]|uniref:DMT family transporter n=1 Tax=unclassified Pseudomonas TaxID=196821 RepID=UPI003F9DE4D7